MAARHPRNQLFHHNPEFVDRVIPYFKLLQSYFRYEVHGLQNIPTDKSCLVVLNHGIIPYHGFMLTMRCIEELNLYPRGLGAGFLFDIPYVREFFLKGGAVNANPKNAKLLLQAGECVMVAPGGIYEALLATPGLKRIPWERRTGFVRTALEAKSLIVPTFGQGIENAYLNSKFLLKPRIKFLEKSRFSMPIFMGLGVLPFPVKIRHYVGKPIKAHKKRGESMDAAVRRVHGQVLTAMKELQRRRD